jgi:hypothetical protein
MDPRLYQIASLAGLLVYGVGWLEFDIHLTQAALTLGGVLIVSGPARDSQSCRALSRRAH